MSLNTFDLLGGLVEVSGVSGNENNVAEYAKGLLDKYGKTETGVLGSVLCRVGEYDENRPDMLIDAHIDEIGMIVTYITDDGFLKVSGVGGLDSRVLPGQRVKICADDTVLDGVIVSTPPHLSHGDKNAADIDDICIDTGLTKSEAASKISLGDRVYIANSLERLCGERVTSHALDNRAGCAAVILALDMLDMSKLKYNLCVMLSTQEEVGERGAKTGSFSVKCDKAVIVDVSFAHTKGESVSQCGELGKGAMIGFAPSLSREMSNEMKQTAEGNGIPFQIEIMSGKTGTNADVIGVSGHGAKTVTLSVPIKHMHTPAEVADMTDIENTAKLICAYLERN